MKRLNLKLCCLTSITIIVVQSWTITPDFWRRPSVNTIAYYKLESDVLDYSWNNKNWSWNPNTFDTLDSWIKVAWYNWASTTLPYDIITWNSYTLSVRIKNRESSWRLIPIWQHSTSYRDFNIIFDNNQRAYTQHNSYTEYSVKGSWTRNVRTHLVCQWTWSTKKLYINWLYCWSNSTRNTSTRTLYMWYDHWYAWWPENCQISQLIVESKIRTGQEISKYFNKIKSKYWL